MSSTYLDSVLLKKTQPHLAFDMVWRGFCVGNIHTNLRRNPCSTTFGRSPLVINVEMVRPSLFTRVVQAVVKPSHSRICEACEDSGMLPPANHWHWECDFLWMYLVALLSTCKPCPRSQAFRPALLAPWFWPGTGVSVGSVWTRQMGEVNCVRNECSQPCRAHSLPRPPAYLPAFAPFSELHPFLINSRNRLSQCGVEHLICLPSPSPAPLELLLRGSCLFIFIPSQRLPVISFSLGLVAPLLPLLEERVLRQH